MILVIVAGVMLVEELQPILEIDSRPHLSWRRLFVIPPDVVEGVYDCRKDTKAPELNNFKVERKLTKRFYETCA